MVLSVLEEWTLVNSDIHKWSMHRECVPMECSDIGETHTSQPPPPPRVRERGGREEREDSGETQAREDSSETKSSQVTRPSNS